MSGPKEEESKDENFSNIELAPFNQGGVKRNTLLFSTYDPEFVFKSLIKALEDQDITPVFDYKKCKISFTKVYEQDDEELKAELPEKSCKVAVRLTQVEKEKICVEFQRQAGDSLYFFEQFKLMKDALDDINDATYD